MCKAEEWRPVKDFPDYEVSSWGRIRSRKNNRWGTRGSPRILSGCRGKNRYITIRLVGQTTAKVRYVHHLVLEAFVGPALLGFECLHGDDDPANNRLDNLRWGTRSENAQDSRAKGRNACGERNGHAKLTEDDVRQIRTLRTNGATFREVARRYGVCWQLISHICLRKRWAHVA